MRWHPPLQWSIIHAKWYSKSQDIAVPSSCPVHSDVFAPFLVQFSIVFHWNLTIFNIICWVAGTNDSSSKCLMFQVLFFFHNFFQNSLQKSFQFIFYKFTKIKIKIVYEIMKKIMPGTSDAVSVVRWDKRTGEPAYYFINWRIFGLSTQNSLFL